MDIANISPAPPQAITRRSRRLSAIWLIPLVAVAIAGWLAWDTISKEGPTIEVSFDSAEGLQAGKSPLKFKDIEFGTVKSLRLSPDNSAGRRHYRDKRAGRAATHRRSGILGRQAAFLCRQHLRPRHPSVGFLRRHPAGGKPG